MKSAKQASAFGDAVGQALLTNKSLQKVKQVLPPFCDLLCVNLFLSPWGVDKNNLIIFFVLVRSLFCSLEYNTEITDAGWIKIAEGVAASKTLKDLK